jgi:lipopolysaccharide O-acetyltransferase
MLSIYGVFGTLRMVISFLYTKLFFSSSRIIRLPFDIRNRQYIAFGKNLTTGIGCRIEAFPMERDKKVLFLGDNIQINDYVHITATNSVVIGNNVLLASKIYISDSIHGSYIGDDKDSHPDTPPIDRLLSFKNVEIKDNVWIGESVSVLPGVTIGKGSIIAANAVVSKDIPDYVIAAGVPAVPIKKFNFDKKIWEKC